MHLSFYLLAMASFVGLPLASRARRIYLLLYAGSALARTRRAGAGSTRCGAGSGEEVRVRDVAPPPRAGVARGLSGRRDDAASPRRVRVPSLLCGGPEAAAAAGQQRVTCRSLGRRRLRCRTDVTG